MLMTRYLMKNLLTATAFIALTLTAVVWLTQSLKILELVANSDAPFGLFIRMVALMLPKFLETILPVSLVISVLFVYNRMIMDNEMVILRSCGFDQRRLARPALYIAMVFTVIVLALATYISPFCFVKMLATRTAVKTQYSAFLLREGIFNTFGADLTVYLRARDQNGDLVGLVIHDTREKDKPPVTITAKRGQLVMNGDVPNIIVFDGMRQQLEKAGTLSKLYFSKYMIEINGLESSPKARNLDPAERTLSQLLHPDFSVKYDRDHAENFVVETQQRIISPFNTLSYCLVAMAILLLGPFNRRGQSRKVMVASIIVAALIIGNMAIDNLTKRHTGLAPIMYVYTFLPTLAALYALGSSGEQKVLGLLRLINARVNRKWTEGGAA